MWADVCDMFCVGDNGCRARTKNEQEGNSVAEVYFQVPRHFVALPGSTEFLAELAQQRRVQSCAALMQHAAQQMHGQSWLQASTGCVQASVNRSV